ncbi:hypothetical protein SCORR_v1c04020 [Spiroplasma corruscae]|uniref:Uncharacterized protein n=1 Tax=Spiroplasma corruscae TaxID=216934 RepID=A0A222ENU4_9MOLU|nr:hypothetical protein [Spiroplasma corruscae]ASP28176.1 hypothetical protein SCORR_v1c04020 [Spiroplasma corruscae]
MGYDDNQYFSSNVEFSDNVGTKNDTKLKAVVRPKILAENFNKTELIKQARVTMSSKAGKANVNEMPAGMRISLANKDRIEKIIHNKEQNSADEIRKRLNIEGKPLNKKRAEELKVERLAFFQKNINKSKSGSLNKISDLSKPPAIKAKTNTVSFRDKKIDDINKAEIKTVKKEVKATKSAPTTKKVSVKAEKNVPQKNKKTPSKNTSTTKK